MNYKRLQTAKKVSDVVFENYHRGVTTFARSTDALRGIYRKTKVPCSRSCCGNPRKWRGEKTLQEIKADISAKEWMVE